MTIQDQTFGQKAVGINFNAAKIKNVDDIKHLSAQLIDQLNQERNNFGHSEEGRMLSIAITKAQEACMWWVKAVTWDLDKKPSEEEAGS